MAESLLASQKERLVSLDVFRGITIASMVLVNNPGSWGNMYAPLGHAQWDGWTPTDFVFPFFLFIVGVAMTFSFDRRLREGASRLGLFAQVFRRSTILVILGFSLGAIRGPKWWDLVSYALILAGLAMLYSERAGGIVQAQREARDRVLAWLLAAGGALALLIGVVLFLSPLSEFGGQRVPGVLQRIAACYFGASLIMFFTGWRGRVLWVLGILIGYWLIMRYLDAPEGHELAPRDPPADAPFPGLLNDWLDQKIFGRNLYSRGRPDPEGLLSTLPAIATVLLGALTGTVLKIREWSKLDKAFAMAAAGGALIIAGLCMEVFFPINKKIWSSSFVIFTGGWALTILALCYYLLDIKQWRFWSLPFVILGTNAILVFWASTFMAIRMGATQLTLADGTEISLRGWLYRTLVTNHVEDPQLASLMWGIGYVALWVILTAPLYYKRIFLKV